MSDELEKFLEERSKIPIPSGDVARVKLLAKELALGVHRELWDRIIGLLNTSTLRWKCYPSKVSVYFHARWNHVGVQSVYEQLLGHGYLDDTGRLTQLAFELVDEAEPHNIFISYRRLDSSALALLVLARLKEHSLIPFVDMALEAGGNWHADLEERIKDCDYFIILLGKDTLSSSMTIKEIQWALQYERAIIPLWHSGFDLKADDRADEDEAVKDAIQQTNAIIVQDESASGYNSAIVELLNRFGVTP